MDKAQHPKTPVKKTMPVMPIVIAILAFALVFRLVDVVEKGPDVMDQIMITSFKTAVAEEGEEAPKEDDVFEPVPTVDRGYTLQDSDFSSSELGVLQSLAKRRDELREKELKLKQREALLTATHKQLDTKMAELFDLKAEIEALLGTQQEEQQARIKSLVKTYETMKAKDAASILNTLDMDILISIMAQMSERKAAPILASMDSNIAREITIKLAEQKKLPEIPK